MRNLENLPEEIFDLLAQKKFAELSESEKQKVLMHLSQEEFENFNSIVADFQSLDSFSNTQTVGQDSREPSMLQKILNYPIPLYQVAAAFLILGFASFLFFTKSNSTSEETPIAIEQTKGKSLEQDNYPDELVLNF